MEHLTLTDLSYDWKQCIRCPLGRTSRHHVLWEIVDVEAHGIQVLPNTATQRVDVVLVGEGPGVSEDVIGRPFIGPSGQLLRESVMAALKGNEIMTVCLTNVLACRPFAKTPGHSENRPPSFEEGEACFPRLIEMVRLMQPRLVLSVGSVPDSYMPNAIMEAESSALYDTVRHPAWVIRMSDQKVARELYIDSLSKAFDAIR